MSIRSQALLDLQEYAWGAQDVGGISIRRIDSGAMTAWGVSVPVCRMTVLGKSVEGEPVAFVTYLSRDEVRRMAEAMIGTLCDA